MSERRYATLEEVRQSVEVLEKKVPSRWEVRAMMLGIFVAMKYDVPEGVENAAIALLGVPLVGVAFKTAWAFIARP